MVYHANYLRYAERGRTEAMREAGVPHADLSASYGLMFVVRRAKMEYLRPARLDQEIVVETETLELGGASALLRQSFRAGDELLAVLEIALACVRVADARPARIPARWRAALAVRPAVGAEELGASAPGREGAG
jgi:acyl-CoA thioester hydrolase